MLVDTAPGTQLLVSTITNFSASGGWYAAAVKLVNFILEDPGTLFFIPVFTLQIIIVLFLVMEKLSRLPPILQEQ
jgi:hypothetical protein